MARTKGPSPIAKITPGPVYALGTPDEIAHRDKVGFQPGPTGTNPIGMAGSNRNANTPPKSIKGGPFKFSNGV